MIRINLLPYRAARRQAQIMQHLAVLVGSLLLVFLIVFSVNFIETESLDDLKSEVKSLQDQNAALKKKIGKIKNIDALRSDVEKKLATVDELQKGRFESLETLYYLSESLPKNAWVSSISTNGTNISLKGWAETNKVVAEFMRQLDASEFFGDVQLKGIRRTEVDNVPVREFELSLVRLMPVEEKGDADSGKKGKSS